MASIVIFKFVFELEKTHNLTTLQNKYHYNNQVTILDNFKCETTSSHPLPISQSSAFFENLSFYTGSFNSFDSL